MAKSGSALPSDARWKKAVELSKIEDEKAANPLYVPGFKQMLSKGLSRGSLVEISGPRSSGKTSLCMHVLAQATQYGEVCAVVDLHNSFHPESAAVAGGVQLDRVLWVRCECNPVHTMRAADLLLHAGGFGVVLLDLSEAHARILNRIPISYWYRFQRAIQNTPTILLLCTDTPQAKASRYSFECQAQSFEWAGEQPFRLLRGMATMARQRKLASIRPETLRITVA